MPPVTIPILAERIETNKLDTNNRLNKIDERLQFISRLVISSTFAIIVAIVVAIVTKSI